MPKSFFSYLFVICLSMYAKLLGDNNILEWYHTNCWLLNCLVTDGLARSKNDLAHPFLVHAWLLGLSFHC